MGWHMHACRGVIELMQAVLRKEVCCGEELGRSGCYLGVCAETVVVGLVVRWSVCLFAWVTEGSKPLG